MVILLLKEYSMDIISNTENILHKAVHTMVVFKMRTPVREGGNK